MVDMTTAKGDCFQVLGFDVFIDANLKAWIFEINDHPSLNINLEYEGEKGLIKEPSEIDKFIKMKVMGEAIKFMKKKGIDRMSVERFKGYHRLLPNDGFAEYDTFLKAKLIYDCLVAKKGG
jgi:hypothetical protein